MKASEIKTVVQQAIREPKEMAPLFLWGGQKNREIKAW